MNNLRTTHSLHSVSLFSIKLTQSPKNYVLYFLSSIRNMVIFRNVVSGQPHSNWWDNQSNQVAFGRGNRGFIVFNNDDW